MSELATEISSSPRPITTLEFLGSTVKERQRALRQIQSFEQQARQALIDGISSYAGQTVMAVFRPSRMLLPNYKYAVPYYSPDDATRKPVESVVTFEDTVSRTRLFVLNAGQVADGQYERRWYVQAVDFLDIQEISKTDG